MQQLATCSDGCYQSLGAAETFLGFGHCVLFGLDCLLSRLLSFQPFAWEAREFLRQKVVGKEILFAVDYKVQATGREYGIIYLGKGNEEAVISVLSITYAILLSDTNSENVAESLVAEGLVEVRQVTSNRPQE